MAFCIEYFLGNQLKWLVMTRAESVTYIAHQLNKIVLNLLLWSCIQGFLFFFFLKDLDMHYEPTDTAAMARTSNLNEELGQVN